MDGRFPAPIKYVQYFFPEAFTCECLWRVWRRGGGGGASLRWQEGCHPARRQGGAQRCCDGAAPPGGPPRRGPTPQCPRPPMYYPPGQLPRNDFSGFIWLRISLLSLRCGSQLAYCRGWTWDTIRILSWLDVGDNRSIEYWSRCVALSGQPHLYSDSSQHCVTPHSTGLNVNVRAFAPCPARMRRVHRCAVVLCTSSQMRAGALRLRRRHLGTRGCRRQAGAISCYGDGGDAEAVVVLQPPATGKPPTSDAASSSLPHFPASTAILAIDASSLRPSLVRGSWHSKEGGMKSRGGRSHQGKGRLGA